jgi:nitroreductase
MDIYEAIAKRKTVYSFSNKAVKEEVIIKILDAARLAPCAGGIHEYEFLVVTDVNKKAQLSQICLTPNINTAPFIIIVFCDPEKLKTLFGDEGEDVLCVENAALAIENIILYAAELGLGSAWIATVQQEEVKKLFDIPAKYVVRGVIPVGYPNEDSRAVLQPIIPKLKEITHIESFNNRVV